jgi:hypothetical protein
MIYFNSFIFTTTIQWKRVLRIKKGLKVQAFDKSLRHVHRHIISVLKTSRRQPYRLVTESMRFIIDTYPSTKFLVRLPNKELTIKRLSEIKKQDQMVLWIKGKFRYEHPISLVKDPAVSRFYNIKLGKPALVPVNHFMMFFE